MIPSACSDDELLRLYDDVFRNHPATQELADRFIGGSAAAKLESELEEANFAADYSDEEYRKMSDIADELATALSDLLESRSEANKEKARKALEREP